MPTGLPNCFGKEIIRFGTWIVTEQGLLAEKPHYFIDETRLWDVWKDASGSSIHVSATTGNFSDAR